MKNKYVIDWDQYAKKAREAAAEGAVLLRNEQQALPLKTGERISVFGRIQFDYYKSGAGSGGMVNTKYVVGILDALKEEELFLNQELEQVYREWIKTHPFDYGNGWAQDPWSQEEMPLDTELVEKAAANSDAALIIIGRTAGEDRDAGNEKGSYLLTDAESKMMEMVCRAFDRVIVVLNAGYIIDMNWVETYKPQAVLYTWQGGMEGGHAVADVLMGRMNPCGKLADTIAYHIEDYSSTANFGGEDSNFYAEDIYVGYRYFETFAKEKVQYPFGFGLSYTSFEMQCEKMEQTKDGYTLSVFVKNTGMTAGKEVVQVYVKAPQGKLGKPYRSLAAFAKTKCLAPGEEQTLILQVNERELSSYDDSGVTGYKSCYVMEAGTYEFYVGCDVRKASLAGSFVMAETKVTENCTEALAPVESFQRMRPQIGADGTAEVAWEPVPMRSYDIKARIREDQTEEIPYTGDLGYKLGDVCDGKIDLKTFTAQLTEEDLICIVRGEGMCSPKVTPGTAAAFGGVTESLKEKGIPCGCCADGPSGIRMDCGTQAFSLPNGTCLACSFNEELSEELYQMEGAELRKNRIDILLGPGINLHRNPLNGRNFEYFSEDPLLTGKMAAAQLRGMQTYQVTGAIKHFAANNQEYHRLQYNSIVSERALRELYLRCFEIPVKEGGAKAIMSTYGAINGLWTASNYDLLTTILRGEWKYDGLVMTDWWAKMNEENEPASVHNLAAMVRCQNDVYMVVHNALENSNNDNLPESLENNTLKKSELQRCAMNILRTLMEFPAMERFLGRMSQEEKEAFELSRTENDVDFDLEYYSVGRYLELDPAIIDTGKGKSTVIGLNIDEIGTYKLRMKVCVHASELAQVPLTIFANNVVLRIITLNGSNGEWVTIEQELGELRNPHNFMKLYFAQAGMEIAEASIEWVRGEMR